MYIPKHFKGRGPESAIAFMQRFNFATMITSVDGVPQATHLPFVIKAVGEKITLTSHLAKANGHWKHIEDNTNLVIFSEPHAYISPRHYEKAENVPTWNYLAVHAYGKAKLASDEHEVLAILEQMMMAYEPAYKDQWDSLPTAFKQKKVRGICAFSIEVTDLQSKEKLSQNKSDAEREAIITTLSESSSTNENVLAAYMSGKTTDSE